MKKILVVFMLLTSLCCNAQIHINIRYSAPDRGAVKYIEEMISSGVADSIRAIPGCLKYEFVFPQDDPDGGMLMDSWEDQAALDRYHSSPAMKKGEALREKYQIERNVTMYGPGAPATSNITINIRYSAPDGGALKYMEEMISSGYADQIRAIPGCLRYEYFIPQNASEEVLLIDCWENQEALNRYHSSQVMKDAEALREKYKIHRVATMPGRPSRN